MNPKPGPSRFNVLLHSVALGAALLLAGCGGSGDSDPSPDAGGTTETAAAARVRAPQVQNLSPADADNWDKDTECTNDSDFIKIVAGMHHKNMLMSRHRHCSTLVSNPQAVTAWIVRAGNGTWSMANSSSVGNLESETLGEVVLETKYQAYGLPNGLQKNYAVQVRVAQWNPNPNARVPTGGHSLLMNPMFQCGATSDMGTNSNPGCTFQTTPSIDSSPIAVSLAAGAQSPQRVFNVGLHWTSSDEASRQNFHIDMPSYSYHVDSVNTLVNSLPLFSSGANGAHEPPYLRCDKNLAKSGTSGCVFPEAAAVFVMDMADGDTRDAAEHVFHAQKGLGTNLDYRSPGVLTLEPNTRVIPMLNRNDEPQYAPLHRITDSLEIDRKRRETCQNVGSMFNTLPRQKSSICPTSESDCNCDEYPFASTQEGGYSPWASVRRINSGHNSLAGSQYGTFLLRQRIVSDTTDPFFVYVKNAPTGPILTVARHQMVAGQPYHVEWRTEGVSSVRYECTAGGTGFWGAGDLELGTAPNGWHAWYVDGVASAEWVGHPSTCHWKGNGQILFTEILETFAGAAAIEITRLPTQANQQFP